MKKFDNKPDSKSKFNMSNTKQGQITQKSSKGKTLGAQHSSHGDDGHASVNTPKKGK